MTAMSRENDRDCWVTWSGQAKELDHVVDDRGAEHVDKRDRRLDVIRTRNTCGVDGCTMSALKGWIGRPRPCFLSRETLHPGVVQQVFVPGRKCQYRS